MSLRKEYNKLVKTLEKDYFHHNQSTDNEELNKIGVKLLGHEFGGVYPEDAKVKFDKTKKYYIFNTDKQNEPGTHWTAAYVDHLKKKVYIFDSFNRQISKLLHDVSVDAKKQNFTVGKGSHKIEQADEQNDCGQRSTAFLLMVNKYGIDKVQKSL